MNHRYSSETLRRIRNDIPIRHVIETLLAIPVKCSEREYQFLCPLCGEFRTGVKLETNLARCFRCERNFNPIDLVMTVRGIPFLDAAGLLSKVLPSSQQSPQTSCLPGDVPQRSVSEAQRAGEVLAVLAAAANRGQQGT